MNDATHYNHELSMYYLLRNGDVYMWHDNRWRMSAYKENDLTEKEGFKEV